MAIKRLIHQIFSIARDWCKHVMPISVCVGVHGLGTTNILYSECLGCLLGLTLEAKLFSSGEHQTQVHFIISSGTLEKLASHSMTKYVT